MNLYYFVDLESEGKGRQAKMGKMGYKWVQCSKKNVKNTSITREVKLKNVPSYSAKNKSLKNKSSIMGH